MTKRIATNRNFDDKSIEYIELHDNGVFFWVAEDRANVFLKTKEGDIVDIVRWRPENEDVCCSFPVDIDFVKEFFTKIGRTFDESKLDVNVVRYPYESYV